ncbi:YkvA family protein [Streptomyces lavendofoliae]|uniref:YkvA family protein n=1 Tax=Streptomyces lavendofoliae TaxID=67314 RepID=UPI00300E837D
MSSELTIVLVVAGVAVAATLVTVVLLLVRLARARRSLRSAGIPLKNKTLIWGAVIYALCPVDLLPDPVLLDDIGMLLIALRSVRSELAQHEKAPAPSPSPHGTV